MCSKRCAASIRWSIGAGIPRALQAALHLPGCAAGEVNPATGRVHTSFNQTGSVTGRLASSDPNLQNIPIRTELGRQVRQAFIAAPGYLLLAVDYSQIELRIVAHMADDEAMLACLPRRPGYPRRHRCGHSTAFRSGAG